MANSLARKYGGLLLVLLLTALCCRQYEQPRFAEIVALNSDAPREYSLRVVSFQNQPNLPELSNDSLNFVSKARLRQNLIAKHAQALSSFAALTKNLHQSMNFEAFLVDISSDDGIAKGRSFESVLALSAFSHLERIIAFAQSTKPDLSFKRPLTVAVYGEIVSADGQTQLASGNDNALYVGTADTVFLLPLGKEDGLPLTMHEGVLAHEFHHRIFFNEIWDNPYYQNLWSLFQSRYDAKETRLSQRSRTLLNALDEGLADVFAVAFTGLPDYLNVSLTHKATEGLRKQRDLDGVFANIVTYDQLATSTLRPEFLQLCGENSKDFENPRFNVYCLGTLVAKAIYEASRKDVEILRNEMLPLVVKSLTAIADGLNEGQQFDLDVFFEALSRHTKSHSTALKKRLCSEVKQRFLSLATKERIPSCND